MQLLILLIQDKLFKPEGAKRTPFGVSLNEGGEVEIVKGQDYIKDLL
jgi:hypothetical protein